MTARIHVIDPDYRRRARIAHDLNSRGMHTEIYEDLSEFAQANPGTGYVFAADDEDNCGPADIVQAMRSKGVSLPIVVYRDQPTPERVVSAMLCGALDYLQWPFEPQLLDVTFRRLTTDGARKAQQERLRAGASVKISNLSPRERDVLIQIVNGLSNKEIGEALKISPRTVEIHRSNLMRKLNAQSASDAVRIALYAGLHEDFQYAA